MFSVIISEKGGAERRETFDRTEINVGRVQGNDLMLPKGNVSKRHARLLFRDGRFIVTDLKSTNGTYVNGRKIAQATIVREGDKIYIGDFVLRIEPGTGAIERPPSPSQPAPAGDDLPSDLQSAPPALADEPSQQGSSGPVALPPQALASPVKPAMAGAIPAPPAMPQVPMLAAEDGGTGKLSETPRSPLREQPRATGTGPDAIRSPAPSDLSLQKAGSAPLEPPSSSQPSSNPEKALRPASPRIEPKTGDRHEVISHFPLEHDPDESVHFAVPAAPRVPFHGTPNPPRAEPPKPIGGKTLPVPGASPAPPRNVGVQPTAPGTPFHLPSPGPRPAEPIPVLPPPHPAMDDAGQARPPGLPPKPSIDRPTSPSVGLASLGIAPPAGQAGGQAAPQPGSPPQATGQTGAVPGTRRSTIDGGKSYEMEARARSADPGTSPRIPIATLTAGIDAARAAAHGAALAALIERVGQEVDLSPLDGGDPPEAALVARIDAAISEAAGIQKDRGGVEIDTLVAEARRELCALGPLTPLLDDEDVAEIQVLRHDQVIALRGGRPMAVEVGFSSEVAVGRALRRLCLEADKPLAEGEVLIERRLRRGNRLFATVRPDDHGHLLVLRKPQRAGSSLEDLVRSGTISRAMASLLSQCVAARANILVTGALGAGVTTVLGALAGAGSTEDRVVVLQENDELVFNQPHTLALPLGDDAGERARAIRTALEIRPDRLVVDAFAGPLAAEMVDAMGKGVLGVVAGAPAPTLRQAGLRLAADIAAGRPGLSAEVAREWLASVFDLAIEVARLRDGRHRVVRVAELDVDEGKLALRDIFTFTVERTAAGGAVEGTFSPTGVVPALVDELGARGIPLDSSIFRRHPRGDNG